MTMTVLRMKSRVLCVSDVIQHASGTLMSDKVVGKRVHVYRIEIVSTIYVLYSYSQPYIP